MYFIANACRFFMFGLTQKGGTMEWKKSKFHNPQSASITFNSTSENPLNFEMKKYKTDCERMVHMWI